MKKQMMLVALIATMLIAAGCSKQETIRTQQEDQIGFNVLSDGALRGTAVTTANLTTKAPNFKVWAYLNATPATEYVKGVEISYQGTSWEYTNAADLAYWPSESLDFYAINPANNGAVTPGITASAKTLTYTVPDNGGASNAKQIDLMYAVDKNRSKITRVPLYFKHALSQIVFKGQTISNTLEVEVEKITIANVKGAGTFTLPTVTTAAGSTAGTWTLSGEADQKYTNATNTTVVKDATAQELSPADGAYLILPQTATKWTTTPTTAVTIATADTNHECYLALSVKIKQSGVYLVGDATSYGTVYVPFGGEDWAPSKKYIYTLKFGGGYDQDGKPILQPILYDCTVEDWTDVSGDIELI
ncbi:fimbrillin family protein [Porphyromonas asaccharolytica]|uniref:Fimbrillin family protein n=1 Tax=Porphyromonas asaccharolytica (strain ATCC 25260 / DSM 20707 / BCRC 10618 / CCUG 7834 / JCM 6326 / LMG 13178 / VPI 4198 / B440) TaxID=879243 RepID=F4KK46_PORAD|nr:fimbrillin family protein [Porphyromonas asaccharolytica]AEE12771.1 hypothetical protein Poras_0827 [Porphyromonas asaccharolytica DSM 20707]